MSFYAELLKLRSLPTPKVIAAICFGATSLVALIVWATTPEDPNAYRDAAAGTVWICTQVGALVFGAWMFGVDFAQGTLRRTLITEPRRLVVLANKTAVTVLAVVIFTAIATAFAAVVTQALCSSHSIEQPWSDSLNIVPSLILHGTLVSLMAGAVTLLFRSFTGGLIATFVMLFAIDGLLGIWKAIRDYTFGVALNSIDLAFATGGDPEATVPTLGLATAILVGVAWIAAVALPGALRFVRSDSK